MVAARYVVVHLPAFRLERCGFEAEDQVGLIDEVKSAMRLVALTPAARLASLRLGMTASQARALVPDVELLELDPEGEREDRAALVRAFASMSDRVASPWDDEVLLEVAGTAHLFGGEAGLVEQAHALAAHLGHGCRVAIADDPLAARALAAWSPRDCIAQPGAAASLLAPLPVQALDMTEALVEALRTVGIERIGEWAALDPASVVGRFGEEGRTLHRVARGRCASVATIDWAEHDGRHPVVRVPLCGATSTLQLHFALPGLLVQLADRLAANDLAAVRLKVVLQLEQRGGEVAPMVVPVGVGRPTRSPRILEGLIRARLEGVRLAAPVEEMRIEAVDVAPGCGWQPGLTDRTEANELLPDLLARLEDHLGADALFAAELRDAWQPEASWSPRPFGEVRALSAPPGPLALHVTSEDPVEILQAWEDVLPRPRPVLLLPSPTPLEVRCARECPAGIRLGGSWLRVEVREGPERVSGAWWSAGTAWARDYWAVEVDGRAAWIFSEDARWFLHGWF